MQIIHKHEITVNLAGIDKIVDLLFDNKHILHRILAEVEKGATDKQLQDIIDKLLVIKTDVDASHI